MSSLRRPHELMLCTSHSDNTHIPWLVAHFLRGVKPRFALVSVMYTYSLQVTPLGNTTVMEVGPVSREGARGAHSLCQ